MTYGQALAAAREASERYQSHSSDWKAHTAAGELRDLIAAIDAQQAPPAAVPDGYALVPVEPTEAMQEAFDSCRRDGARLPETYWAAGIAAAQGVK